MGTQNDPKAVRSKAQSPVEAFDIVLGLWARELELGHKRSLVGVLYGVAVGTLTAAKLLLRFASDRDHLDSDPGALAELDSLSDELADRGAEIARALWPTRQVARTPLPSERPLLRLAGRPANLRWCGEWLSDNARSPIAPAALVAAAEPADRVLYGIMDFCGAARDAVEADGAGDIEAELRSEFLAVIAAAKLAVALGEREGCGLARSPRRGDQ
jgi:hypothetical protein